MGGLPFSEEKWSKIGWGVVRRYFEERKEEKMKLRCKIKIKTKTKLYIKKR